MNPTVSKTLEECRVNGIDLGELFSEYVEFAEDESHDYRETSAAQHFTASAYVFNSDLTEILLCFHRKGQFWVQFGGHIEPQDQSLFAAAQREGLEESGLSTLEALSPLPVDIDRHALSSSFGTCRVHWDIGFAFGAGRNDTVAVSHESEDVKWWPVDALPADATPDLPRRISRALQTLRRAGH